MEMKEWITGRNPVYECLRAGRRHFFQAAARQKRGAKRGRHPGDPDPGQKRPASTWNGLIETRWMNTRIIPQGGGFTSQRVSLCPTCKLFFDLAGQKSEPLFMLILDQIQDPQNMGTLIRSAEVFGVHGMVIPAHRSAGVTPAVVNALLRRQRAPADRSRQPGPRPSMLSRNRTAG